MKLRTMALFAFLGMTVISCASTGKSTAMSPKDEARYANAIESADAANPPMIQPGDTLIVDAGRGKITVVAEGQAGAQDADVTTADGRHFVVKQAAYDAFFAQSPATVLAKLGLEPIQDGMTLLGYRVTEIREPLEQVDLRVEDIIVGIDGKIPKSPDEYFDRWQNAQKTGHCTVNVQRGVDRFDLSWIAE